jgi:GalNAc-alpha-(1->4)-GalNAc-alpha-(1->3)-diNAcBac-PP-undecaprenol alpha-1,4-N-acetyl-D-galactosaminyltransferase
MTHVVLMVSTLARGGAERVAVTLANAWARRGDRVRLVCTFGGPAQQAYPLDPRVDVVTLDTLGVTSGSIRPGFIGKVLALRRWFRGERPDVVISFLTNVNVTAVLATAGLRIPLIVSERVDPAAGVELPWVLHVARALCYSAADVVVVQTPETARNLSGRLLGSPTIRVVPNPLPGELARSTVRANHDGATGRVVAIGRLTPQKGFDRLLEAFARAFPEGAPWTLEVYGEGALKDELQADIGARGLRSRAFLRGATDDPWRELAGAQIFALTSHYEGFPNAMLEAMALGLACVAFDCPAGPRFLAGAPAAAAIVANGDVAAFAAELRRLADDAAARASLGTYAAAHVRAAFSEAGVLLAWDETIRIATAHAERAS